MAKINTQELIESLKEMTILELNEVVKAIEEAFGVTAAAPVAAAAAPAEEEVVKGPSEVSVYLTSVGASKLAVVKAVQAITGLGLGDAKKLTDVLPSLIKEKISPAAAEDVKAKLTEAGAEVEVK
jgi:large subunit ribosomal protein L7/L12